MQQHFQGEIYLPSQRSFALEPRDGWETIMALVRGLRRKRINGPTFSSFSGEGVDCVCRAVRESFVETAHQSNSSELIALTGTFYQKAFKLSLRVIS